MSESDCMKPRTVGWTMENEQLPEKPERDPDGSLDFHHLWRTFQGEGPRVGTPAVFVRLAGCNLQCSWCDTDYTSSRRRLTVDELLNRIWSIGFPRDLIVLTGGEPFRQNLTPLVEALLQAGRVIQVETNGTLFLTGFPYNQVEVVCSPKTAGVNPHLAPHVKAWKYVLSVDNRADDGLPKGVARPLSPGEVFVQPMDEQNSQKNQANLSTAMESCLRFGYRLSVQVHKIIGVE